MSTEFQPPADPDDFDRALTPAELREADLLEAILCGGISGGASGQASSGEMAELVSRVRSACAAVPPGPDSAASGALSASDELQARRVAGRVLARTTREDMRRRGDVGVILGFAADRLRDSAVLRVAAALLIVQLTLVPLVAWQVWKAPHSGVFHTGIEPSAEALAATLADLPADEELAELGSDRAEGLDRRLERIALELSLAETGAELRSRGAGLARAPEPSTATGEALRWMTVLAVEGAVEVAEGTGRNGVADRADDSSRSLQGTQHEGPRGGLDGLVVILEAEAQLELLVRGGGWDGLPESLEKVAEIGRRGGGAVDAAAGLKPLAARTMRRAELLGVAIPPVGESLIEESSEVWIRGSEAWLKALGAAARSAEPADAYIQAWCAAIVQDS